MPGFTGGAYQFTPDALQLVGEARLAYIRKVYSYFGFGILTAAGGALLAMNSDLVFFAQQNRLMMFVVYLGAFFLAQSTEERPNYAFPTMLLFTTISGVTLSPLLYAMVHSLIPGSGPQMIYDALLLTGIVFGGLTVYVFITKKDFSNYYATILIGFLVLFGALILNFFLHSSILDLSLSIIGTLVFSGFVLVHTSIITQRANQFPPTRAALWLYLDFVNLFVFILRLLMGGRGRR